ncbi:FAD-dependent oxidoreductase [Nocardioides sp. TF02-7]|uniref:FAD-dependent oxidoreductase n=1 Tax=Nocardioides sp. TF02-7 TaxID=2917724 RepID=UPI001F06D163|nr:FAD-dependent oxidoreductase [Nocardioides sp. TF02-7]UMG91296.1 FAD-dependent oxidoreductase [Nocardioides sp. TF02-7]
MADEYDVVVLGSGAAGLTAAFTAAREGGTVLVVEKNDRIGGTSAWSGGHLWVPDHPHLAAIGVEDSAEEAIAYLTALGRGVVEEPLVRALVEAGPRMIAYLERHGSVEFFPVPGLPDYHPELPGGKPGGGRTLGTDLFCFDALGDWQDRVEQSPYYPYDLRMDETPLGRAVPQPPTEEERARRAAANERGMGHGLVGLLLAACLREGVRLETATPARELVISGGRVTGVVVDGPGGGRAVTARRGVVLATGGFEWNPELCATFLRGRMQMPVSIPTNTGDGLVMAMRAGAALQNMREAWWIPVAPLPSGVNAMDRDMINGDRTRPRSIMVNRAGRRFTNEAANYNAIGGAFHQEDVNSFDYANLPAWVVFDHGYLTRYGSTNRPYDGQTPPWLTEGATLAELAGRLGIPAGALEATVARWNGHVAAGADPDFGRGESAHDRWWGDPYRKGTVEATLGPIDEPPFYALELTVGALGTKGGPKVDAHARVIDLDGRPIEGLYAVGNASSPTGPGYGGPGGTLGPGMTFGWIAGRHVVTAR